MIYFSKTTRGSHFSYKTLVTSKFVGRFQLNAESSNRTLGTTATLLFSTLNKQQSKHHAAWLKQQGKVEIRNGSNCIIKYGKLNRLPMIGPVINYYFPNVSPESSPIFSGISISCGESQVVFRTFAYSKSWKGGNFYYTNGQDKQ